MRIMKNNNNIAMVIRYKKLNELAVPPFKTHEEDFCYDVVAVSEEEIAPNVWKYGTGLAFDPTIGSLPEHIRTSIDLRPRSSVWKTGMVLSNCIGTIDEDYRGDVSAVFYHVIPSMPRYRVGDKIGQIHLNQTINLQFELAEELSTTDRGEGGYGSTGR